MQVPSTPNILSRFPADTPGLVIVLKFDQIFAIKDRILDNKVGSTKTIELL